MGEKLTNTSNSIAVVTDENVGRHYGEQIMAELQEFSAKLIMLPAGEEYKNQETLSKLWDEFHQAKLDRQSAVVALGGGVIGDLTGFAAATYLRGIDWVNVPTSLLAMVDASIGGKTGIDLPMGKNLAGAFHPPRMVLIDPDL